MNDAFLVGSIANGDADALRPLIERYRQPLAAVLRHALGRSPDIDDVFQETWLRVVRSAHRYDPEQRFSSWLLAIAWNLIKDRWASQVTPEEIDFCALPAQNHSPEDQLIEADRARRIRDLVSRLPDRLAQAIFLRYFEELSERDVAQRLGIPVGTVKSRLHHGLKRLASTIDREGYEL